VKKPVLLVSGGVLVLVFVGMMYFIVKTGWRFVSKMKELRDNIKPSVR
jgi:hypothetical protein